MPKMIMATNDAGRWLALLVSSQKVVQGDTLGTV